MSPQPQPQTLPLLSPPLCTIGWFTKKELIPLPPAKKMSNPKKYQKFATKKGVLSFAI